MKRPIILLFVLIGGYHNYVIAQNTPVVEKAAPKSNNTLPSGGTLGSNSGVNPMGNPGTIINSSANSSAVNSTIAPHPNVEPGTFLNSSPQGTVIGTIVNSKDTTTRIATTVTSSGTVTAVVHEPTKVPVTAAPALAAPNNSNPAVTKTRPIAEIKEKQVTVTKEKLIPAYHPVLGNYVSEQTVNKIKSKYGSSVYDIRTIRIASNNKIAYIVRLLEDGKLRNELYYDEP